MWVVGPGTLDMIDLVPGTESQGTKSGTKLGTKLAPTWHQVTRPLLRRGLLAMILPTRPNSSQQKYRLTSDGAAWLSKRATNGP